MCRKLLFLSSFGWLFVLLMEPLSRRLRNPCGVRQEYWITTKKGEGEREPWTCSLAPGAARQIVLPSSLHVRLLAALLLAASPAPQLAANICSQCSPRPGRCVGARLPEASVTLATISSHKNTVWKTRLAHCNSWREERLRRGAPAGRPISRAEDEPPPTHQWPGDRQELNYLIENPPIFSHGWQNWTQVL